MKSEGFLQPPQDIMEEYNGCSVPQYTAYPCDCSLVEYERITRLTLVSVNLEGFKRSGVVFFDYKTSVLRGQKGMVDAGGFEPPAFWLQTRRSSN